MLRIVRNLPGGKAHERRWAGLALSCPENKEYYESSVPILSMIVDSSSLDKTTQPTLTAEAYRFCWPVDTSGSYLRFKFKAKGKESNL